MAPRILCILLSIASVSCAGQRLQQQRSLADDLSKAERLLEAGCYTCLQDAFSILGPYTSRSEQAARTAFAIALLLGMREKELGLEAASWLQTASALANAAEQPYVDVAATFPWEHAGVPEYELRVAPRSIADRWRAALQVPGTRTLVREYLRLAVECRLGSNVTIDATPAASEHFTVPLLQYRAGICHPGQRQYLESVLETVPNFTEAAFYLARHEIASAYNNRDWARRAVPLLEAAHESLPQSPLIGLTLASVFRARSEFSEALTLYDETLARRPTNRDALLGRTIALSELHRSDEAIVTATRMLELGTWHVGDAHYWRAWNLYHRKDLEGASRDIAEATKLLRTGDVFGLSGLIAYDQARNTDAERDFTEALRLDRNNCTAAWYLGMIANESARWSDTSRHFVNAAGCYERAAEAWRQERVDLPPDWPARSARLAELDQRIGETARQAALAWFNAAHASAREGQKRVGLEYARRAAAHEELKSRAVELIISLKSP